MARDSAVDDGTEAVNSGGDGSKGAVPTTFDRRSYLKLAGGVAAAATLAGPASAAGEYEEITARGQTIRIGSGETFENKLIDVSSGNSVLLYVTGGNSVIRNIGFKGLYRGDQFLISFAGGSGDILVENIYMGDGATKEGSSFVHGPGAVFMHKRCNANITFRNCNVQGFPNNGFYCSNTASGGSVHFDTCFGKNNGVTTFRCASGSDLIENCVAYNDTTDYGSGYGGYGETNGRPVWVWNGGTVTIRDSHFADGPYPYAMVAGANGSPGRANFESGAYRGSIRRASGSTVSVGSAVSSNPDLSIPDGVPRSAEQAASGGERIDSSGGSSRGEYDELAHTYEFVAESEDELTDYYFEIEDGPIKPSTYNDASIEGDLMWVSDDGTRAAGRVVDGRHAWEFDSLLVDVTVEGPADPFVDDSPSNLDRYPLSGARGDDWKGDMPWHNTGEDDHDYEFEHSYEFVAEGEDEPTDYYVEIEDGPIEPSTLNGATVEQEFMWVSDDGTRAAGRVVDGRHAWEFDTLLVDVTVDGPADPFVDGNPSHLGRYPQPGAAGDDWKGDMPWHNDEHTLLIDGVGTTGRTHYEFRVSGDAEPTTYQGASINDDTEIVDGHVTGTLRGWRDAFEFSGDIESLTIDGAARVSVDGEHVDPTEYGEELSHVLTIVSNGSPASYAVSVDGRIETIAWDDSSEYATISAGQTASGSIESSYQRFRYSGSVTDLTFSEGSAMVYAGRNRIRPGDF